MAKLTVELFLDMLRRSQLVDEDQLTRALQDCQLAGDDKLPDDEQRIADHLIGVGLLTPWQFSKLTEKKYKGFFLGQYKLLDHLSRGGMSSVYLAEHIHMRRRAAVKVLPKNRVHDPTYFERFYLEAKAAAALDHPNIVRAYDINNEGDTHYLVMEYVQGSDLQRLVRDRDKPLEYETAADYVAQAARGLQHAHDAGIVHRDVKPANLLVDDNEVVKILDMGLAQFADEEKKSATLTRNDSVLGTADYLAPEQAINSHTVDSRADIYSLGCTFYYLLVGHAPFPDGALAQRIVKHQTVKPVEIRRTRPDCPKSLLKICDKMMEKKPDDRYQTADEVANVLHQWLAQQGHFRVGQSHDLSVDRTAMVGASNRQAVGGQNSLSTAHLHPKGPHVARPTGPTSSQVDAPGSDDTVANAARRTEAMPPIMRSDARSSREQGPRRRSRFAKHLLRRSENSSEFGQSHIFGGTAGFITTESNSIIQTRRQRKGRAVKTPIWLWIGLAIAVLLAIWLTFVVVKAREQDEPVEVTEHQITCLTFDPCLHAAAPCQHCLTN